MSSDDAINELLAAGIASEGPFTVEHFENELTRRGGGPGPWPLGRSEGDWRRPTRSLGARNAIFF
jgi:hypothetical protein